MAENNETSKKIQDFFRAAIKYWGKEISLPSNQFFSVDQIRGEDRCTIQYGYPQSGGVILDFVLPQGTKPIIIDKISVFAPPIGADISMANFASQLQEGSIGISVNLGMNMGTQEHSSIQNIGENPNALNILDIAADDLNHAEVLGEFRAAVPEESDRIPWCNSTQISKEKGKSI